MRRVRPFLPPFCSHRNQKSSPLFLIIKVCCLICAVGFFFLLWYALNVVYNDMNKTVLKVLSLP